MTPRTVTNMLGLIASIAVSFVLSERSFAQSPTGPIVRSGTLLNPVSNLCVDLSRAEARESVPTQLGGCLSSGAAWEAIDLGRGEFALVNKFTRLVLDVNGGSTDDGAIIQQYTWNGSAAQRWRTNARGNAIQLVNVGSGKCVDIANRGTSVGSRITQWSCHDGTNQQFQWTRPNAVGFVPSPATPSGAPSVRGESVEPKPLLLPPPSSTRFEVVDGRRQGRLLYSGLIVSRASSKCIDLDNARDEDGVNIQQWTCHGGSGQLWDFYDAGNNEMVIVARASRNRVMDVAGANRSDGANIAQYVWNGGANQRWRLEATDPGFFRIVSVSSDKCVDLDTSRDVARDGANVLQWSCHGKPNQQWRIEIRGSGSGWANFRPSGGIAAPSTSFADPAPTAAIGSWQGFNPAYQSNVRLTIRADGKVLAEIDGGIRVNGYFRGGKLFLGAERYDVQVNRGVLRTIQVGHTSNVVHYAKEQ